jgi:hypothetical protein
MLLFGLQKGCLGEVVAQSMGYLLSTMSFLVAAY